MPGDRPGEGGALISGGERRRSALACALLADGALRLDADRQELTEQLLAVPGIGPDTAAEVAQRVTGDPDVLLTGDPVLRRGAAALGLPDADRLHRILAAEYAFLRAQAS